MHLSAPPCLSRTIRPLARSRYVAKHPVRRVVAPIQAFLPAKRHDYDTPAADADSSNGARRRPARPPPAARPGPRLDALRLRTAEQIGSGSYGQVFMVSCARWSERGTRRSAVGGSLPQKARLQPALTRTAAKTAPRKALTLPHPIHALHHAHRARCSCRRARPSASCSSASRPASRYHCAAVAFGEREGAKAGTGATARARAAAAPWPKRRHSRTEQGRSQHRHLNTHTQAHKP